MIFSFSIFMEEMVSRGGITRDMGDDMKTEEIVGERGTEEGGSR